MNYNYYNYSNQFHLVATSPYPLLISNSICLLMIGLIISFNSYITTHTMILTMIITMINIILWITDIIIESTYFGMHTNIVEYGISIGFLLFIASEALLFLTVFWALFHSSLAPTVSIGSIWPPLGINTINAISIPLLNTIILLSSSISITSAHYALISRIRIYNINYLIVTQYKAIYFITLQYLEYKSSTFTITDSIYGTVFYTLTGLHGIHIIAGFLLIIVVSYRIVLYHTTDYHHLGLIVSITYWHFVDILWLLVYCTIY